MNTAQQALELLNNDIGFDDINRLSDEERKQFGEICYHWYAIALNVARPKPWDASVPSQAS